MVLDLGRLEEFLDERGVDGYLVDADGDEADQYYLAGFHAPDPFLTLYDGETRLLFARSLEFGRAQRESRASTVERATDYGYEDLAEEYGRREARWRAVAGFLDAHDVDSVATPPRFPLETADGLRNEGIEVAADGQDLVTEIRATKTAEEVESVRAAQAANQRAMARAEALIAGADVDEQRRLRHEGEVLTSERVRREIEFSLLEEGCAMDETIVACGTDAADPHERGSGPLVADEPIIVDVFPRDKDTRYHGDLTRTFTRGTPDETVRRWYDLTAEAKAAALAAVEPGVTGEAVHAAACEVYENAGLPTLRSDPTAETGFIHSTGHGVGLEVHELPSVAPGGETLEPGNVITIEPGLYDPAVGGVRIEDLVVVTEDGFDNLTDYEEHLVVGH